MSNLGQIDLLHVFEFTIVYKYITKLFYEYHVHIFPGTYVTALTDEQFSYHHAKLFGVYNHLVQDPWNLNAVYIIDTDWNIRKAVGHVS
jgi:hypothetical protein